MTSVKQHLEQMLEKRLAVDRLSESVVPTKSILGMVERAANKAFSCWEVCSKHESVLHIDPIYV